MFIQPIPWWIAFFIVLISPSANAQDSETPKEIYKTAMTFYERNDYEASAEKFRRFFERAKDPSRSQLYNGACVFALVHDSDAAFKLLNLVADNHFYSDVDHLSSDPDLKSLRNNARWQALAAKVKENKATLPQRTRELIKRELFKARRILDSENGKLWGAPIWSNEILVLDFDNTIHSLVELPGMKTEDGVLFFKTIPENTLGFSNSAQMYDGKRYAVVMVNYLEDNSSTIIHELFHVLQLKAREFRSDPVNYLDEHDARILLRLEFQALCNALSSADSDDRGTCVKFLADAVSFRNIRQSKYTSYQRDELEIETLEGMANYTGMKLSSIDNKFREAIDEIRGREAASTYTRPFPYATGPAYGLLFDYLQVDWRSEDFNTVYNFREIFQKQIGRPLAENKADIDAAKSRNNYAEINAQETARKEKHDRNVRYYTQMLLTSPTLTAKPSDGSGSYSVSFDMNGTLVLGDEGIVYSQIKGVDVSGNNFGSFNSIAGKDQLGVAGILRRKDGQYIFPRPVKVEGKRIVGEYYEIQMNDGWEVRKVNDRGDLGIVKTEKN